MSDHAELALYESARALPEARRAEYMMAYNSQKKDRSMAFVLSLFLGHFGIDRFYLGQIALGLGKLFTLGCLGLWWFIDLFLIMRATDRRNAGVVAKLGALYAPAPPEDPAYR